ncbi:hypothetical protein [Kallotenue papyrolyticum]|uniref:hypothetical protein n=1 Tax=Kallotenue papyrolyticum TaxID=1325125 RepID=UPI0004785B0F|nr:hypothetical protein [Kallotenue papyrolyticum]
MNYRTATDDQLRKERLRLLNLRHVMQQRHASALSQRGGRQRGFRSGSTAYGLERELLAISAQLAEIEAELAVREQRQAAATATPAPPVPETTAAAAPAEPAATPPSPRRTRRSKAATADQAPASDATPPPRRRRRSDTAT